MKKTSKMDTLKLFIIVKLLKILQPKRNKATLLCLKALGYPMKEIRWSLCLLNGVRVPDLGHHLTRPTFYAVLNGNSSNELGRDIFEERLGVEKELLFQDAVNQ
jgi:hypothetical protein